MNCYHINHSSSCIKFLRDSHFYIKYKLSNPIAATNFYSKYMKKIELLKSFPLGFQKIENTNYRRLIFDNWIILYEVQENIVFIRYIFNSRQNYLEQINQLYFN